MASRRNSLTPPERRDVVDPGAHDLESSDSEEHYSDAKSGPISSGRASPIPKTRVERVDDKPAYGEVPGTEAYRMREGDALPDEIAIIPDPGNPTIPQPESVPRSPTPGGRPIPKTVVEETPDTEGSITHPQKRERRLSDAHPDVIVKPDGQRIEEGEAASDSPIAAPSLNLPVSSPKLRRKSSSSSMRRAPLSLDLQGPESAVGDDDDFGDEFDDFEEGGGDVDDADFGDFDDGFQEPSAPAPQPEQQQPPPPPQPSAPAVQLPPFPIPDFEGLSPSEILSTTEPYLTALFPPQDLPSPSFLLSQINSKDAHPIFLTPRSASLWSQLVAPPPLQPPDWIRSRIRRLFLVSLGVPVDLDEILPADTKQKKLVLPSSTRLHRSPSSDSALRRASSDSRRGAGKPHGSSEANADNSTDKDGAKPTDDTKKPDSSTTTSAARKQQHSPERAFDVVSARRECARTDAALRGMTDAELRAHVARLVEVRAEAERVLKYWQRKADEQIAEREAFEGVIENLVKHARKVRK
ncbi:hypothetical protein VTJ04DRAFT_1016 [Mycothermus thermophilus]|uniref:uncharacterized protein n=1 Tax=Humicola insolens TaxID=85995 RepID=UPI0037424FEC